MIECSGQSEHSRTCGSELSQLNRERLRSGSQNSASEFPLSACFLRIFASFMRMLTLQPIRQKYVVSSFGPIIFPSLK